jgi:membrane protease YdiL (CAAX protease family)
LFAVLLASALGLILPFEYPWDILTGVTAGVMASALYRQAKKIIGSIRVSTVPLATGDDVD